MAETEKAVQADKLQLFLTQLYACTGMDQKAAELSAYYTVQTNLWGIDSHGALRTPVYVKRIKSGAVNSNPSCKTLQGEDSAIEIMDGDDGLGYVVADFAMERAMTKARQYGMGAVVVKRSNHFGAAALFAKKASDAGMIGIAATNVMPNIGMKGNKKPCTGNNPIAFAVPTGGNYPFMLDISMSAVAGGKLLLARKKGEKIPKDWAVTKEGLETDDPKAGFEGFLLPVGRHKGFGLSLFVDIITGVLSGGAFLQGLKSMYANPDEPSLTSHVFCVINPYQFWNEQEFMARMKEWVGMIKAVPMVDPGQKQIIPGEPEYLKEQERRAAGIPLTQNLIDELNALARDLGADTEIN